MYNPFIVYDPRGQSHILACLIFKWDIICCLLIPPDRRAATSLNPPPPRLHIKTAGMTHGGWGSPTHRLFCCSCIFHLYAIPPPRGVPQLPSAKSFDSTSVTISPRHPLSGKAASSDNIAIMALNAAMILPAQGRMTRAKGRDGWVHRPLIRNRVSLGLHQYWVLFYRFFPTKIHMRTNKHFIFRVKCIEVTRMDGLIATLPNASIRHIPPPHVLSPPCARLGIFAPVHSLEWRALRRSSKPPISPSSPSHTHSTMQNKESM